MAFTLTATVSGTTSNSYLTVAEADDYFASRLNSTAWTGAATATKEAALVQAARRIDQEKFSGIKSVAAQSMLFPRGPLFDAEGRQLSNTVIPKYVQYAVCELAYWYLTADDRLLSESDLESFSSYAVGPISVSINARLKTSELPTVVQGFLEAVAVGAWTLGKTVEFVR